jgi:hypothetical protein
VTRATTLRAAACLAALVLAACGGGLEPGTLQVSPLQPPDVDPMDGFGGRVLLEAHTDATAAVFHLELFHGTRMELRREVGRLPLVLPARLTMATETTAGGGSLRVELEPADPGSEARMRSFACALPDEFPATGAGMTSPSLVLEPATYADDAFVPVFGVRRGGTISFTGPEGPFGSSETVLRVVLRLE